MKYDFDEIIDRRGTDALKVEGVKSNWGREDLMPMWVADMDFRTPPFIMEAIRKRCEHEILGYTCKSPDYFSSIGQWLEKRYQWKINEKMIQFTPGVVAGLALAINCFSNPGDKVLIQTPVYHPFFLVTEKNERKVVYNPLILEDGQYRMNMEEFRELAKECKIFILCNPHNPGGRVWSKEELSEVAEICYENNVLVLSDEIHADLTLPGFQHIPFATVSEKARMNSLTFMATSKAFNMPGLSSSYSIIENESLRRPFISYVNRMEVGGGHLFAFQTVAAAYKEGADWLSQLVAYIKENVDYLDEFLKKNTPKIKAIRPQASYLVFLDCRELGLSQEKLIKFFVDDAHLALNQGAMFGKEGAGFMRLNIGCPKSILQKALNNLKNAYDEQIYI